MRQAKRNVKSYAYQSALIKALVMNLMVDIKRLLPLREVKDGTTKDTKEKKISFLCSFVSFVVPSESH